MFKAITKLAVAVLAGSLVAGWVFIGTALPVVSAVVFVAVAVTVVNSNN